jgi:hypothetical protein
MLFRIFYFWFTSYKKKTLINSLQIYIFETYSFDLFEPLSETLSPERVIPPGQPQELYLKVKKTNYQITNLIFLTCDSIQNIAISKMIQTHKTSRGRYKIFNFQ